MVKTISYDICDLHLSDDNTITIVISSVAAAIGSLALALISWIVIRCRRSAAEPAEPADSESVATDSNFAPFSDSSSNTYARDYP